MRPFTPGHVEPIVYDHQLFSLGDHNKLLGKCCQIRGILTTSCSVSAMFGLVVRI